MHYNKKKETSPSLNHNSHGIQLGLDYWLLEIIYDQMHKWQLCQYGLHIFAGTCTIFVPTVITTVLFTMGIMNNIVPNMCNTIGQNNILYCINCLLA